MRTVASPVEPYLPFDCSARGGLQFPEDELDHFPVTGTDDQVVHVLAVDMELIVAVLVPGERGFSSPSS